MSYIRGSFQGDGGDAMAVALKEAELHSCITSCILDQLSSAKGTCVPLRRIYKHTETNIGRVHSAAFCKVIRGILCGLKRKGVIFHHPDPKIPAYGIPK